MFHHIVDTADVSLYVCVVKAVRNITWNTENLRNFVDKNHGKEFDGE